MWIWLLELKYNITTGSARSGIDNSAVITRLSSSNDTDGTPIHALATDYDLWQEHVTVLSTMRTGLTFFHVKGHQDEMHTKHGIHGPLTQDAHWNVAMDKLAESYRLPHPTPLTTVFRASRAALVHGQQVLVTKVDQKI